ncbi:oxidoreductase [Undibacter mobilis]|uniref:Oxidoreductase n=2 Tax=Undibacter mobilis TaxID=2292256 RepID=A0A371BE74_9BRAD|nr:oxidoreductase [Undibacter mobilis]
MMPLRVTRNEPIADGIHLFEFREPGGLALPEFSAGAHIAVRVPGGAIRKYSLCNDPTERDRYQVAVKRDTKGSGASGDLIDKVKAGDTIMIGEPVNDFALPPRAQDFLFIAGGIGITPIMAMIRQVRRDGKRFRLVYIAHSPGTAAFREELSAPELRDAVTIHYDHGDPAHLFDLKPFLKERLNREHLYCCGPRSLMEAVREMTDHWSPAAVHFEAFTPAARPTGGDRAFRVKLAKTGTTLDVPADKSILEVLRANGLDVPSSCETGTCGTCRAKVLAGEVDHRDLVLSHAEKADTMMICVSRAKGDEITLDR